jgi:hypothetical protein
MKCPDLKRPGIATALICCLAAAISVTAMENDENLASVVHREGHLKLVPAQLNYQGSLANAADSSAVTATLEMTFRLFDSQTKGAELWSETHPAVQIQGGLFQALLGSVTSFPEGLFDGSQLWLQTEVGTEVLSPRKPLVSVAYSRTAGAAEQAAEADHATSADQATSATEAQHAVQADTAAYTLVAGMTAADSATVAGNAHQLEGENLSDLDNRYATQDDLDHLDAADGDPADAVTVDDEGQVGIGTTSPARMLDVNGEVGATAYYGDGSNLTGISGTTDNDWTISGSDMYASVSGNVGVGTASPAAKLDVGGNVNVDSLYKIWGRTVLSIPDTSNTFVGVGTGTNNMGAYGTFMGLYAGHDNQGHYNSFIGGTAGSSNTTGEANTFVGAKAGVLNTTGTFNTFVGQDAGGNNTTGGSNTFIGQDAGNSNTTGQNNTFVGRSAGLSLETGSHNTFLGVDAGFANASCSKNTFIGWGAGFASESDSGCVFIGYQAGFIESGSNKLYIANSAADSSVLIYGDFSTGEVGIGTTSPGYRLQVGESGDGSEARANAWNTFSSREYKKDISPLRPDDYQRVLQRLGELDVVRYHYKEDAENRKLRIGLIAEDAPEEMTSEDGQAMSLSDSIGFLLAAIKAQQDQIKLLRDEIDAMRSQRQDSK